MSPRADNGRRTYTLGQVVLALAILLGLAGGVLAVTDRFATASSLTGLESRLARIEARVDALYERLIGDGRRGAP